MADRPSLFDYVNLLATLAIGGLGIYIAVKVADSADRLSRENMLATTATYLLDDSPKRRQAGVNMVNDTFTGHWNEVPAWVKGLLARMASDTDPTPAPDEPPSAADVGAAGTAKSAAPSVAGPPQKSALTAATPSASVQLPPAAADTAASAGSPSETTADSAPASIESQLFSAVGGGLPRVFIHIADDAQRAPARDLRKALLQEQLHGDPIIAPRVEKPHQMVKDLQLRFLKSTDQAEATELANRLTALLGTQVHLVDKSQTFGNRPDVKGRTYELWFPSGQAINVHTSEAP